MNNSFNDLGISPSILKALEEMGFETPTEVQSRAIPHILNREDLTVMSKTGSGKTAVFGVPMLQMTDPKEVGPQGLILTPSRELAVQVDNDLKQMAKHLEHKTTAVYGQHSMNLEIQAFKKGVTIITGTPGRLFDHINRGNLVTKHIRFLVLDEADRMLDMGFIDQVVRIIKTLPKDRVTLLFSATIPSEIRRICRDFMKHPVMIEIESLTKTVDIIEQAYYRVERNEKRLWLNRLLLTERPESCMIFCNTRLAVDQVQGFLTQKGYASEALHGDIPQGKRLKTIDQFKQGEFHLLVATDVAARGLHIDNLSLVINYDVPLEKDGYVHRIGRTGRAGNVGRAVTLVTSEDIMSLYGIEEHIGAMIAEADLPSEAVFNEQKDEIDKWIQENAMKAIPPRAPVHSLNKEHQKAATNPRQSRPPNAKPHQQRDPLKGPPIRTNTDQKPVQRTQLTNQKTEQRTRPVHPVNTNQKTDQRTCPVHPVNIDQKQNQGARSVHPAERANPVHAIPRSVPPHSQKPAAIQAKGNTEITKSQEPVAKQPLLKRLLKRITGK